MRRRREVDMPKGPVKEFPVADAELVDLYSGAYYRVVADAKTHKVHLEGRIALHARDIHRLRKTFPGVPLDGRLIALADSLPSTGSLPGASASAMTVLWDVSTAALTRVEMTRIHFQPSPGSRLIKWRLDAARRVGAALAETGPRED